MRASGRSWRRKGRMWPFDLTCTGLGRKVLADREQPLAGYVRGLLGQFPCMRMSQACNRDELIRRYAQEADGLIYHTVQFCDNYAYEYTWLRTWIDRPMLLLETDYTRQSYRPDSDPDRSISGVPVFGKPKNSCEKEGE